MSSAAERPKGTDLRVVVWNCYGRVDRKLQRVMDELAPDVIVVPESEPTLAASVGSLLSPPILHAWIGDLAVRLDLLRRLVPMIIAFEGQAHAPMWNQPRGNTQADS